MKHSAKLYAKAFISAFDAANASDKVKIVKRFLKVLEKNGDFSNVSKIEKEMQRILVKRGGGRFVEVETARPLEKAVFEKLTRMFSKNDNIETRIHEELLAGTRILIDEEREFNFSFKRKLRKLFS